MNRNAHSSNTVVAVVAAASLTVPKQKITFTGSQGEKLAAALEMPDAPPAAYVLFAHCFTCTKDIFSARYLTEGLLTNGCAVLRFDFTGLGESEGEFENTNFSSNVADLIAAADYLRAHHQAPALLVGHSLGGAAVLAAAPDIAEARAVATIGAPAEPAHVAHLFADAHTDIEKHGVADVLLAGRPFRIKKQFLDDIAETRLHTRIAQMNKALLIFHSVADKTVGIDNARKIYEAAKHPKTFVSLDNADHLLSDKRDAVYISNVLSAWAGRYLGAGNTAADDNDAVAADDQTVTVKSIGSHLAHKINSGKHELITDEPASLGGANTGPAPYVYLLSALGACTAITLRMYANLKKLPLAGITVKLAHSKTDGADTIERTITLDGEQLTAEQKTKLFAIAEKCPVHKTLKSQTTITSRLNK